VIDAAIADGAAADAADAGPVTLVGTIALPASPSAMAFNGGTTTLYVALAAGGDAGAEIVVIDGTSNTIQTTIPNPSDAAAPVAISAMAVDPVSNVLYAAASSGAMLYVIDGTTQSVTAAIPMPSDTYAIQVDPFAHVAYALGTGTPFVPEGGASTVTPATITLIGGADASTTTIQVNDLATSPTPSLALDSVVRHLYVCGANAVQASNATTDLAAIDTLDTALALDAGATQQGFGAAREAACAAGWGGGAIATSSPSAVDFIAAAAPVSLPSTFVPQFAEGAGTAAKANVVLFGYDSTSNALEIAAVEFEVVDGGAVDGGTGITVSPTSAALGTGTWSSVAVAAASGGVMRAYVAYGPGGDAGATSSVGYASILMQ